MFKEKTSKKRLNVSNNNNSTLDVMHNKMIKTFSLKQQEKEDNLDELGNKITKEESKKLDKIVRKKLDKERDQRRRNNNDDFEKPISIIEKKESSSSEDNERKSYPELDESALLVAQVKLPRVFEI